MRSLLVVSPARDIGFREFVESQADRATDESELQRCVRRRYPDAIVRPHRVGGQRTGVWEVYRGPDWYLD